MKKHVLVCNEHSHTEENQTLLKEYVTKCILGQKAPLKEFSKEIKVGEFLPSEQHLSQLANNLMKQQFKKLNGATS